MLSTDLWMAPSGPMDDRWVGMSSEFYFDILSFLVLFFRGIPGLCSIYSMQLLCCPNFSEEIARPKKAILESGSSRVAM